MKKIGMLSDTHGVVPKQVYSFFEHCDEIWHAGDIGNEDVLIELQSFKPVRAVYGNIDDFKLYKSLPKVDLFECENLKIMMTHIGGRPHKYIPEIRKQIAAEHPSIFICGHSHILLVAHDSEYDLLHINPGAAGKQGFHQKSTLIRLDLDNGTPKNLEVMEFPKFSSNGTESL